MDNNSNIDYEAIDNELQEQIGGQLKELEDVKIEATKIGDPKKLVDSISQIVWEQFVLQIAGQAGKDFIAQNNNLNLSLKKADHYLNQDSFIHGKTPSHNFENAQKYQERYDKWNSQFTDSSHEHLAKDYRQPFDANREKGNSQFAMDHTIPVKEFVRDEQAATYMSQEEKVAFANNTDINLKPLDREANASKSDKPMNEWLNSKRVDTLHPEGQTPDQRFNIKRDELEETDKRAREEWEKTKQEAQKRAEEEGRTSLRNEATRSLAVTTQAIAVALLAKLTRTIFQELIRWLAEKDKKTKTFFEHIKKAIIDFLTDFKNNVLLSIDVGVTVIFTQLFGEIVPMIRKALLFVKIGGESLFKVAKYLKDPANAKKETSVKILEIGKIVTISLTTAGAVGLGMVITGVLAYYIPALTVQIPLLGSPASLLGIFFGGLTAGICGAIVLHNIEGTLEGRLLSENRFKQLTIQNSVLALQDAQFENTFAAVNSDSKRAAKTIENNLKNATNEMQKMRDSLDEDRKTENEDKLNSISSLVDGLD